MHTTPASLLQLLRQPGEQAAWERFVQIYTPLLCHWAHRLGLHGADADDLVQDVFTVLVDRLPLFRYDPKNRFRGWLWTMGLPPLVRSSVIAAPIHRVPGRDRLPLR